MNFQHTKCYIKDYPRPQFVRKNWQNLNGEWDFYFDYNNVGESCGFANGFITSQKILVPFAYQCPASGIGNEQLCPTIWYQRHVNVDKTHDQLVLLHLEGCDYNATVWVNGKLCGKDSGGYHRMTFDITNACNAGDNLLVIKVTDDYSRLIPRGKQRWEKSNFGCWYVDIAGIYKTAWLEVVHKNHIQGVKITSNLSDGSVSIDFATTNQNGQLQATIWYQNQLVEQLTTPAKNNHVVANLSKNLHLWEQGKGNLYDLQLDLVCDGVVTDSVGSYFGMREISIQDGRVLLNGKPLYQRLILDQGYWPQSALTPPNEQSLEQDITLTLQMGFNGARKHQKVEDERYLYYADVYGFIVWAEMPSMYDFTEQSAQNFQREWLLAVHQQYNHPCILCWVPFNESWGVEHILKDKTQQDFVNKVYHATKQIDSMRPVITNDGWEHTISDFVTLHHYTQDGATLTKAFGEVAGCVGGPWLDHDRQTFAQGYQHQGQPILLTEFGGTSFVKDTFGGNWGYGSAVANDAEYLARLGNLVDSIRALPHMQGFCYTQLTDVYQEVNGLLYFDRTPKQPLTSFAQIFGNKGNK